METKTFKVGETAYISLFVPGRGDAATRKILRPPGFIPFGGPVFNVFTDPKGKRFLSIQFAKWPVRYMAEETNCYATVEEAEKVAKEMTTSVQEHVRQPR